jgi:hypothetical protein
MTTSSAYSFDPDFADLVLEAFERIGIDPATITARHAKSARRSVDFLFSDWANRGPHLWAIDQQVIEAPDLIAGTATYDCPEGTVAILEMVVRRNGVDTPIHSMARDEYLAIPNKTYQGLPNRFYFDRQITTPTLTFWNVPENDTDKIIYYRMRQLQDAGAGMNTADIPHRWQEALVSGLAAKLAEKYAPEREQGMLAKSESKYKSAFQEDRERSPTTTRVKYSVSSRRR